MPMTEVTELDFLDRFINDKGSDLLNLGIKVLVTLVLFWTGQRLITWIRKIIRNSMERANVDKGVAQFADSLLKYGMYVILAVFLASSLGVESTSIAALFASAGMAVSLAMQGSLSNLAGGILILVLKPFVVGDYIIEDTNGNEGTVKEIQIFYTKLATIDNKTIVIPNGTLSNNSLTNVTAAEYRQLDLRVGISYEADLKKAKEVLMDIIEKDHYIVKEKDYNVFVDELADSSVVMGVRAWVKTEEFMAAKWAILEKIKLTLDENGIEIPYNQLQVHLDK